MNHTRVLLLTALLALSNLGWWAAYRSLDQAYIQESGLRDEADALLRKLQSQPPPSSETAVTTIIPSEVIRESVYTLVPQDRARALLIQGSQPHVTLTLPIIDAQDQNFATEVVDDKNAGTLVVEPTKATINGLSILTLARGQSCFLYAEDANWYAVCKALPQPAPNR
jgi:hypothetical protein